MSDIIKLLPESLANQIAAGEVVQRPASVVKELLENAIDAGATDIKLILKEAGKTLIQVIDNGSGMSETDARMSFERHATSKIKSTNDLFSIKTMGFRGEALASIAAVAQVELKTRLETQLVGTFIKIEGTKVVNFAPQNTSKGTSISVKNLFYNVPARRNFLKGDSIEFNHCCDEFKRIAIAYPEKSFSFTHNDSKIFILHKATLANRIIDILGNGLKGKITACKEETPLLKINGYIGKPETAKKKRSEQFLFVNNRYIKSNYLHHSISEAFGKLIDDNAHPSYILFLEIDPKHIDINVHPTKTEIKFDDEKTIYYLVNSAIRKALSAFNLSVNLDFDENVNNDIFSTLKGSASGSFETDSIVKYQKFSSKANIENWQTLYQDLQNHSIEAETIETQKSFELKFESKANTISPETNQEQIFFQIHNSFIVTQMKSSMLIIDQQAAHERVLYDKFIKDLENQGASSQQFLFPLKLELSQADFLLLEEYKDELTYLGFSIGDFGKNTIVINGMPTSIKLGEEISIFESFIESIKFYKASFKLSTHDTLARALAKRACIKRGKSLEKEEMYTIVEQLMSSSNPSFSPDGRSTIISFSVDKLNEMFAEG